MYLLPNFPFFFFFFLPGHQVQEHEKLKQAEKELLHKDVSFVIMLFCLFIYLLTLFNVEKNTSNNEITNQNRPRNSSTNIIFTDKNL